MTTTTRSEKRGVGWGVTGEAGDAMAPCSRRPRGLASSMMMRQGLKLAAAIILAAPLLAAPASAQQQQRDCVVKKEASGLVRGDRVPRGCVLVDEDAPQRPRYQATPWRTGLGPCEAYSERIDYTPNVKKSALTNMARTCRPALQAAEAGAAASRSGNFGSPQRNFGSGQRNFGSGQRNFGSGQRNFGSGQRNFGSGQRNFGSSQRSFGSSRSSSGSRPRNTRKDRT
jgi:hypothetical protein